MKRTSGEGLLTGEWACLGILYRSPNHGFGVAARLRPDADIGRIWSLSRALTYRSLEQLTVRALIEPVREEPGIAGGSRTVLSATRRGRAQFRRWLHTPVDHLRDLRSELLLKIVFAAENGIDIADMLDEQQTRVSEFLAGLDAHGGAEAADVVSLWRREAATGALRFLRMVSQDRFD